MLLLLKELSTINARCLHPIGQLVFPCFPFNYRTHGFYSTILSNTCIKYDLRETSIYYCAITTFFPSVLYYLLLNIFPCVLDCRYETLSSFFFMIRKCLFPNNGEVTSLIHRSSDKLSAHLEARRPPPFLPRQPFASAFPLVLLPFTIYTRMARANRLISRDLIRRSIKIFTDLGYT